MRFRTAVPVSSGATGRVLRAHDEELGVEVALKLLHRDDPEWVRRMQREAAAQARLDHPNIGKVHGTGVLDGQPYIAMQFIDGATLDRAAAGMSDRDKAAVMVGVADALACAHAAGLVHRDLKPSNILVARDADGGAHPYVIDFGVVRDTLAEDLTRTGELLGTPGYIAPEVAVDPGNVDTRADLYAFGVVLYELLAGRRPFVGDSAAEVIMQAVRSEPPPLARLRPDIDPSLARIVHRCLEREADWRYPDAIALRDDLVAFRDGRRVTAPRDTRWRRWQRFARRHPWRARLGLATGTLAIALVALGIGAAWYARDQGAQAQDYMGFAARIESTMRFEYLKPAHDLADVRQRLADQTAAFEKALPRRGWAARRVGQLALGRAHAVLGSHEEAVDHLELAWQAGERSGALSEALGETRMRLYFAAFREASAIRDEDLRRAELRKIDTSLRDPAEAHLARASREAADPRLASVLLDHLRGAEGVESRLDALAPELAWPVDALLFAAELAQRNGKLAQVGGDNELAAQWFGKAERHYRHTTEIARSHPAAMAGICRLTGDFVSLRRYGGDMPQGRIDAAFSACDRAISLDSRRARGFAAKAAALDALVMLARSAGEPPGPLGDAGIAAARRALELAPDSLPAARALGALLTTRDAWALENGAEHEDLFVEATRILGAAQQRDPHDATGAMMLANAHNMRARAISTMGEVADAEFQAAERALLEVAPAGQAPLVVETHLASVRADYGYALAGAGRDAEPLLRATYKRMREVHARAPRHLKVNRVFALTAWTLADFLVLAGKDPRSEAKAAIDAYAFVLEHDAPSFTSLFNALGPSYTFASAQLDRGDPALEERERMARYAARLAEAADEEASIDIQLLSINLIEARAATVTGEDPRPAFATARQNFVHAERNPIDRLVAWQTFAILVASEHAWRRAADHSDAALAAADRAQLDHAVAAFPESAPLHAYAAEALAVLARASDLDPARQLLDRAIARMPVLAGRFSVGRLTQLASGETRP